MRVYLGSDHAGFELKQHLLEHLPSAGHEVVDCGAGGVRRRTTTTRRTASDGRAGARRPGQPRGGDRRVRQRRADRGQQGARHPGGAGLERGDRRGWPASTTTRNVVAIGARMHTEDQAATLVETFLATPFSNGERHVRRIELLADYEASRQGSRSAPTSDRRCTSAAADPEPGRRARAAGASAVRARAAPAVTGACRRGRSGTRGGRGPRPPGRSGAAVGVRRCAGPPQRAPGRVPGGT